MPPAAKGRLPLEPHLTLRVFFSQAKSFSGGPGGRFFKKAPLAAGGKK